MRIFPLFLPVGVVLLLWGGAVAAQHEDTLPLESSDLENVESRVRAHLEELQRSVVDAEDQDAGTRGNAWGELGRAYAAYGQPDPAVMALENASRLAPEDYRWSYFLGVQHQLLGRFDTASSYLNRVLELNGTYGAALLRLAQIAHAQEDLALAEERYQAARERGFSPAAALEGLGRIAFERGDFEQAVDFLEKTRAAAPEANAVNYALAQSYRQLGQMSKARAALEMRGDVSAPIDDPLIDGLRQVSQAVGPRIVEATKANAAGRHDVALQIYREAVALDPENSSARRGLATSLTRLGRQEEAIAEWRKVVEIEPGSPIAHYNLGLLTAGTDRAAAIRLFEQAVSKAPDFDKARFNLAVLQEEAGNLTAASANYQALLESTEQQLVGESRAALARFVIDRMGQAPRQEELGEALEHLTIATASLPTRADLPLEAARMAGSLGRHREAARLFEIAVDRDSSSERAWFGGTLSLMLLEDYRGACSWLERARTAVPGSLPIQHIQARVLATVPVDDLRDPARAIELAGAVLQKQQSLEHAETLAMAYAAAGDYGQAIEWQTRIVEVLEKQNPDAARRVREQLENYRNRVPPGLFWLR